MWSNLATDFDQDEETANFGTRLAVEAKGNLYDVVTFAMFEPTAPVERNPCLASQSNSSQTTALAIDSCLHVVETSESNRSFSVIFAANIDALAWSPCRRFVIAGLASGEIQVLHVPSKKPLPAMRIRDDGRAAGEEGARRSCFVGCGFQSDCMRFFATDGCVYSVTSVDLEGLHGALDKGDLPLLKAIQSRMKFSSIRVSDETLLASAGSHGGNFDVLATDRDITLLGVSERMGQVLPMDYLPQSGSPKILRTTKVMKNVLFCLDDTGTIHIICLLTMLLVDTWAKEEVLDFVLMEDDGDSKFKILMTVQSETPGCLGLQMREYPSFDLVYELKVSQFCYPLDCTINQETPMFVEGSFGEEDYTECVQSLRVRGVCESVLEARLQRLLRRQKFDEAENFARKFGFPLDQVHQAKSTWLLEQLSPWKEAQLSSDKIKSLLDELRSTLLKMTNLEFMVRCCVTAALPSLQQIRELLLLAREIIQNNVDKDLNIELMVMVSKTLQRLETFSLAYPGSSIDEWVSFARRPAIEECKSLIRKQQVASALLVWTRHKSEISEELDTSEVAEILEFVSSEWDVEKCRQWLGKFLPDSLQMVPDALPLISSWAYRTARSFELTKRKEWPQNGLLFAEGVLTSLCFSSTENEHGFGAAKAQLILNRQRNDPSSELSVFIKLIHTLRDLRTLHEDLHLRVKLADFLNDDKFEVVTLILDWCTEGEEICHLISYFLSHYLTRCGLEMSAIFTRYLQELIQHSEFNWHWHLGEAPWEKKAAAIVTFISCVEDKANVVLTVTKAAPVPWSKTVQQLCFDGVALNHPVSSLIKEQEAMVEGKRVLRKYNFTDANASGRTLERLIQFMIKDKGEEGYKDALEVAKVSRHGQEFVAHFAYLKHLLWVVEDSKEALDIFQRLLLDQEAVGVELAERLLIHAELSFRLQKTGLTEAVVSFFSAVKLVLAERKKLEREEDLFGRVDDLKRRAKLFDEFGIKEKVKERSCQETVDNVVQRMTGEGGATSPVLSNYHSLMRLSSLIQCPREHVLVELLKRLTGQGKLDEAADVCKYIEGAVETTPESVSIHKSLVLQIDSAFVGANCTGQLPEFLTTLAAQSASYCEDALIVDCVELSRWQYFLHRIHDHFHHKISFSAIGGDVDPFSNVSFQASYSDKGLPLDRHHLEPFVECMQVMFHEGEKALTSSTLLSLSLLGQRVVEQLRNTSHIELSLSISVMLADFWANNSWRLQQQQSEERATPQMQHHLGLDTSIHELIPKILCQEQPDFNLALGYLMMESKKKALNVLMATHSTFGLDYNRIVSLAVLGVRFCQIGELVPPLASFKSLLVRSAWGRRASELNVTFKDAFSGGHVEYLDALKVLLTKPDFTIRDISQYCVAFNIDVTSSMLLYIKASLLGLEPIVTDAKKVLKPLHLDVTLRRVLEACRYIENPGSLKSLLLDLFEEVNPYNYEVLAFTIEQLEKLTAEGSFGSDRRQIELINRASCVLGFFLQYERTSELSEKEKDTWMESRLGSIPRVCRHRFPVSWLVQRLTAKDKFKVLKKEISLANYPLWCGLARILKLSPDNVCVQAVQNAVEGLKDLQPQQPDEESEEENWNLSFVNRSLVAQVQACIEFIVDPQKAVSCGHWFATHLQGGADKIMAVQGCRSIALNWCDESGSEEAEQALALATLNLLRLTTLNILHKYELHKAVRKLDEEKSTQELLRDLYADPSIVERSRKAGGHFPDINRAAEEIAEANDVDVNSVKFELLDRWLPETTAGRSSINSNSSSGATGGLPDESVDAANFTRCVYVAQGGGRDVIEYLLRIGFSEDVMIQAGHKLRALKCLLAVADDDRISDCSGGDQSAPEVREHLQILHFVTRLAGLNLPYTAGTFLAVDKSALVESVLRNCSHSPQGISLLVDLCLHFGILDTKLWVNLLQQMVRLVMVPQLRFVLLELNHHSHLWHFPAFLEAWNFLLQHPFSQASVPLAREQKESCEKVVDLLNCCPLATDLNVKQLWGECVRLNLGDLAKAFAARL